MEIKEIGKNNVRVTRAAKLLQRKHRAEQGRFLASGKKLAREAAAAGLCAQEVYFEKSFLHTQRDFCDELIRAFGAECEYYSADSDIIKKLSSEESAEGVVCVFLHIDKFKNSDRIYNINSLFPEKSGGTVILLDRIRDPGNLGTVIRTAYAFGVDELIMSPDCADIYNPKVLRGSMGAAFSQPISVMQTAQAIIALKTNGYRVFAAALHRDAEIIGRAEFTGRCAFVIGNEANGLTDYIISLCDGCVFIPIAAHSESLNAAVAACVIMWEITKNRD